MIELYKLIHGNYDRNTSNIINLYKDHNKLNERTRGHTGVCGKYAMKDHLRKESFPNRAVNMWNFLPEHVVQLDRELRTVIHVKRAKRFDTMG